MIFLTYTKQDGMCGYRETFRLYYVHPPAISSSYEPIWRTKRRYCYCHRLQVVRSGFEPRLSHCVAFINKKLKSCLTLYPDLNGHR